jgi:hypothetical protein
VDRGSSKAWEDQLKVYWHSMRRDQESRERLQALVGVGIVAPSGTRGHIEASTVPIQTSGHSPRVAIGRQFYEWARRVSNLRPLACEEGAKCGFKPRKACKTAVFKPLR